MNLLRMLANGEQSRTGLDDVLGGLESIRGTSQTTADHKAPISYVAVPEANQSAASLV